MMGRRIFSATFWSLVRIQAVLTLAMLVLFSMTLIYKLTDEQSSVHLPLFKILQLLILGLPSFANLGTPFAYFFTLMIVYVRIIEDNEAVALSSLGFSPVRIYWPACVLSLVLMLLTLASYIWLEPMSMRALKSQLARAAQESVVDNLKPQVVYEFLPKLTLYFESFDKTRAHALQHIFIVDEQSSDLPLIIQADRAILNLSAAHVLSLNLEQGSIEQGFLHAPLYRHVDFERLDYQLNVGVLEKKIKIPMPHHADLSLRDLYQAAQDKGVSNSTRAGIQMIFAGKFAFPLAHLILCGLFFPFTWRIHRASRVLVYVSGLTLIILYFVVQQSSIMWPRNYGINGYVAAFGADLVMLILCPLLWLVGLLRARS